MVLSLSIVCVGKYGEDGYSGTKTIRMEASMDELPAPDPHAAARS